MNTSTAAVTTKPASTTLVAEWSGSINVGIYDNCTWSIRLYEDRAIVRMPGVKWQGNSGGYHLYRTRETGRKLAELLAIAARESADAEDYTADALEVVSGY
jgi:hypothetical protein